MDFGLAHDPSAAQGLTQSGALIGTPQYMSPEQARSDVKLSIDAAMSTAGAMLYDLLTGQPPFTGDGIADILLQVIDTEPMSLRRHRPDLPLDLENITLKCLQKEPAARYESANALADDLRRYLDGEPYWLVAWV